VALATTEDVNTFLDESKVYVTDADSEPEQIDAERIIRGMLAGFVDPAQMALWKSPNKTPILIRSVAGRLVAAFRYRKLYSEDVNEVSPYAQQLYNEAMDILRQIVNGTLSIVDLESGEVVDIEAGASFTGDMFYPGNKQDNDPRTARKFGMDLAF
jgi:phage gp36-like protein